MKKLLIVLLILASCKTSEKIKVGMTVEHLLNIKGSPTYVSNYNGNIIFVYSKLISKDKITIKNDTIFKID